MGLEGTDRPARRLGRPRIDRAPSYRMTVELPLDLYHRMDRIAVGTLRAYIVKALQRQLDEDEQPKEGEKK